MRFFLFLFFSAAFLGLDAAKLSPVEGIVYLKDGRQVRFEGQDRIVLPAKCAKVVAYRDIFQRGKQKETFAFDQVDSLVCWHSRAPEHRRKYMPVPSVGWCWVYFETPYIRTLIYSDKGYVQTSNGGIQTALGRYYLEKTTERNAPMCSLGKVKYYHRGKKFRQRIARYVQDRDPGLARRIEQSTGFRDATLFLLKEYRPQGNDDE